MYVLSVPVGYEFFINGARVLAIKSANRSHVELAFDTRKQMIPAGSNVHLDHAGKRVSLTIAPPRT